MTVRIELPPDVEAALRIKAQAQGLSVDQWLLRLAEQQVQSDTESTAHLQKTNPEEWGRQFRAWAQSHDPNLPVLSDEAMSRESIYPDRI